MRNYYTKWHNLDKIKERAKFMGRDKASPLVEFLSSIGKQKMAPKGLGFVNRKGHVEEMNLNSYYIGDKYAEALSEGLQISKTTRALNLSRNCLGYRGLYPILAKAPKYLLKLDLSNNPNLGVSSYELLASMLLEEDRK